MPNTYVDYPFLGCIAAFYVLVEGLCGAVLIYGSLITCLFEFKVSVYVYGSVLVIGWLPWTCRAAIGALTDLYPLWGHHKRYYAKMAIMMVPMALFMCSAVRDIYAYTAMVFIVSLCTTTVSALLDGEYITKMHMQKVSRSVITYVHAMMIIGFMIGVIMVGIGARTINTVYIIAAIFTTPAAIAMHVFPDICFQYDAAGHYTNETFEMSTALVPNPVDNDSIVDGTVVEEENACPLNTKTPIATLKRKPSREDIILTLYLTFTAIVLFAVMYDINETSIAIAFLVSIVASGILALKIYNTYHHDPILTGIYLFAFLLPMTYGNITPAMDMFMTGPPHCVKGPYFDLMFYIAETNILSCVFAIGFIYIYLKRFQNERCLNVICAFVFIRICSSITDIIIAKNWYRDIGVSANVVYILGHAMLFMGTEMIIRIALIRSYADKTIHGQETFNQAVMTSLISMGSTFAQIEGIVLMRFFNVHASMDDTHHCHYEMYVPLIISAHVVMPLFAFPLAVALLP